MSAKRVSKTITKGEDIDYLINLSPEDISQTEMMKMFGSFNAGEPRFHTYDIITLPAKSYGRDGKTNSKAITTTIGRLLFNKAFILKNKTIFDMIGYYNEPINKKNYGKLMDKLGYWLLEDKITVDDYKAFCNMTQEFMPMVTIISPGFTEAMLTCTKKINARKEKLLKEHKADIDAGNLVVIDQIQKELLAYAREILKDDPAMDMFNSGVGGTFDNNFKNMFIMRGTVRDPDPNKGYNVITSNLMDGISAEEYTAFANTLAEGPYNRSKKTEVGGYWEKLMIAACQHVNLLPEGSDCGTKHTIEVEVTDDLLSSLMYSYIVEGDKLIELTSDNMDKYRGKKVRIRFSSLCEAKNGICSKCAGNAFYRQGLKNVGVRTAEIPSKVKNIFMKSFHDSQVRLYEMDPMKAFGITD